MSIAYEKYAKKYYENNKEKIYKKNAEYFKKYQKEYYAKNKDLITFKRKEKRLIGEENAPLVESDLDKMIKQSEL